MRLSHLHIAMLSKVLLNSCTQVSHVLKVQSPSLNDYQSLKTKSFVHNVHTVFCFLTFKLSSSILANK